LYNLYEAYKRYNNKVLYQDVELTAGFSGCLSPPPFTSIFVFFIHLIVQIIIIIIKNKSTSLRQKKEKKLGGGVEIIMQNPLGRVLSLMFKS